MKRAFLTSSSGFDLMHPDLAEIVIPFTFRFVDGPLPLDEFAAYVSGRSETVESGVHWSDFVGRWPQDVEDRSAFALAEFCQHYDVVELWFDRTPNDQLQLICLQARWYRDVFDGRDAQDALIELAEHPAPPVLLDDPAFDNEDRYFGRSEWRVTLTELGHSLVAREDDMWRHNPIKRWWGGTKLTNERLWRWDRETRLLIAP